MQYNTHEPAEVGYTVQPGFAAVGLLGPLVQLALFDDLFRGSFNEVFVDAVVVFPFPWILLI